MSPTQHSGPVIWLLTDGKPGHLNQLRGLGQRLNALTGARMEELTAPRGAGVFWHWLTAANPMRGAPAAAPDLAIAAGSGTQSTLLAVRRHFHCPAILLMRPNFPYRWFDGLIVPEHDAPPERPNVLVTQGVINAITPLVHAGGPDRILLLIGGHSQHYGWDSEALVGQIRQLMADFPSARFTLSDSRRTPDDLLTALRPLAGERLAILSHRDTPAGWLAGAMADATAIWVTPDSVSMVYESITSGRPTGIFELPARGTGRVTRGIARLTDKGWLTRFDQRLCPPARPGDTLWEADRAARWLVARFFPGQ